MQLGRTVSELEATVTPGELNNWWFFYELEPWGYVPYKIDLATTQSLICNFSGNVKNPIPFSDFLPERMRPEKPKLTEEVLEALIGK